MISLAAMVCDLLKCSSCPRSALDDAEDVVLAEDEVLFAVDLHLVARVLAEEDPVPLLDVGLADGPVLEDFAIAHRNDHRLDGLLLRGVGDEETPLGLLFFLYATNDHPVLERSDL